jgi:hypothetical protein
MATIEEKQELVQEVLDLICDRVDGGEEVAEVMLNAFGFLMQDMGMTLHETMSAIMDYYKTNPMTSDADH